MRRLWLGAVLVVSLAPFASVPGASHVGVREFTTQAVPVQQGLCHDGDGKSYSRGAMIKVREQVQQCADGKWTFADPSESVGELAKKKGCRSTDKADKDQEYASGLLRKVGETIDRCDDGKWIKDV